ncbi:MAG: MotA/TolQ/ExbB proton channel family protein [Candidatus Firestonebacteria bacterium]
MFTDLSFLRILEKGGYTIIVLIIFSVLSVAVFLERLKTFYGVRLKLLEEVKNKVRNLVLSGKISDAISYCERFSVNWLFFKVTCPLTNVFKIILFSHSKDKNDLSELAMRTIDKEMIGLEKYLGILGTIGNISLYVGLFGTVLGIMHAFQSLAIESAAGPSVVASGIAEALVNTAAGLFVAITAVVFYNYFLRSIKKLLVLFEDSASELIELIKK